MWYVFQVLRESISDRRQAIKQGLSTITSFLLSLNPSLLYCENSTGRTPLEMSRDMWIASCAENPPSISANKNVYYPGQYNYNSLIHKAASGFVEKKEDEPEESKKRTWEICAKAHEEADDDMRKRRLVSLFEANEVAKRVAGRRVDMEDDRLLLMVD
jgi:hypothetical protein